MARYTVRVTSAPVALMALVLVRTAEALTRHIGGPHDPIMSRVSEHCNGTDQANFKWGKCAVLMGCVLDNISTATTQGLSSGGAISSLIPTILALIGAPPLDLVKLALLSPHRALATCCFGVGLPSGLFGQLSKPLLPRRREDVEQTPCKREWVMQLPTKASGVWYGWKNTCATVAADLVVVGLASVMLWYNYTVNAQIMVTWRCEWSFLLFSWPIACVIWLLLAIFLLWLMHSDLQILHLTPHSSRVTKLSSLQLLSLQYRSDMEPRGVTLSGGPEYLPLQDRGDTIAGAAAANTSSANPSIDVESSHIRHDPSPSPKQPTTVTNQTISSPLALKMLSHPDKIRTATIVICISMPQEYGIRSWRWYEAILETLAVGIYLYATFVLSSTVFMSGEMALTFATTMTICLSGVRLLGSLF